MSTWDPQHYLRFSDQRTRAAADLAGRVAVEAPAAVIDLGCGPGNSTQVLRERWPDAHVTGLDSSAEMIAAASEKYPDQEWVLDSITDWSPAHAYDVVYSNATLQWLPDHEGLVARLFTHVAPGGALAFQVPSAEYAEVHAIMARVAHDPAWASRMAPALHAITRSEPSLYYDALAPAARGIDLWETLYYHVMDSHTAIVDWIASTGMRPYLEALADDTERERFKTLVLEGVEDSYEVRVDGRVLFPFRRTFVIAYA